MWKKINSLYFTFFILLNFTNIINQKKPNNIFFDQWVIDGPDDQGIDAVYFDFENHVYYFIQSKFSTSLQKNDVKKFANDVKDIINKVIQESEKNDTKTNYKNTQGNTNFNNIFKKNGLKEEEEEVFLNKENKKYVETFNKFYDFLKDVNTKKTGTIKLIFSTLSDTKNEDINSEFKRLVDEISMNNKFTSIKFDYEIIYYESIKNKFYPHNLCNEIRLSNFLIPKNEKDKKILFDFNSLNSKNNNIRIYYASVPTNEIYSKLKDLYKNDLLFSNNIRNFLGRNTISKKIEETLVKEPENFLLFNNGITILANYVKYDCKFSQPEIITIKNFSIVNGAQTVSTILETKDSYDECCNVLVKIIEIDYNFYNKDNFRNKITISSNEQNKVTERNIFGLSEEHKKIFDSFSKHGYLYEFKKGKLNKTKMYYDSSKCIKFEELFKVILIYISIKRDDDYAVEAIYLCKNPFTKIFSNGINDQKSLSKDVINYLIKTNKFENVLGIFNCYKKIKEELQKIKKSTDDIDKVYTHQLYFLIYLIFDFKKQNPEISDEDLKKVIKQKSQEINKSYFELKNDSDNTISSAYDFFKRKNMVKKIFALLKK